MGRIAGNSLAHAAAATVLAAVLGGCGARPWQGHGGTPLTASRATLARLVTGAGAVDPQRFISHLSHTCDVRVGAESYPVVDLQETVPGAATPRGVNWILVFSPAGALLHKIEYTTQRPLSCVGARLYVWGDLHLDGQPGEGNELTFGDRARSLSVRHVEAREVPVLRAGKDEIQ